MPERKVTFKIVERIGVIAEEKDGWNKELNRVSWNGAEAKWDIRSWDADHLLCNKGLTFKTEEIAILKDLLDRFGFK